MIRDVEFFATKLGKLDGFGDAGENLLNLARSKEVKAPEPPPAPAEEEKSPEKGSSVDSESGSSDHAEKEAGSETPDERTTTAES
jgi:vacuolar protein sorting-associated protein 54